MVDILPVDTRDRKGQPFSPCCNEYHVGLQSHDDFRRRLGVEHDLCTAFHGAAHKPAEVLAHIELERQAADLMKSASELVSLFYQDDIVSALYKRFCSHAARNTASNHDDSLFMLCVGQLFRDLGLTSETRVWSRSEDERCRRVHIHDSAGTVWFSLPFHDRHYRAAYYRTSAAAPSPPCPLCQRR